jgi:hypothetical protein
LGSGKLDVRLGCKVLAAFVAGLAAELHPIASSHRIVGWLFSPADLSLP